MCVSNRVSSYFDTPHQSCTNQASIGASNQYGILGSHPLISLAKFIFNLAILSCSVLVSFRVQVKFLNGFPLLHCLLVIPKKSLSPLIQVLQLIWLRMIVIFISKSPCKGTTKIIVHNGNKLPITNIGNCVLSNPSKNCNYVLFFLFVTWNIT